MMARCKLNPCCGATMPGECKPPPQFRSGESWEDYSRRTEAATPSGASAAVRVKDWRLVAKAAGRHGIRYRTNAALEAFLTDISCVAKAEERQDG